MPQDPHHPMWKDKSEPHSGPRTPVRALLDNLRSAQNVGDIFRTADALIIERLHCVGITAFPPNSKLEKTALGASETVPWSHHLRLFDAVEEIRGAGLPLIAVEMTPASRSLFDADLPLEACFVFGHEVMGVDRELIRQADAVVHLPMGGQKNSLNVSSSFAVTLYHHLFRHGKLASGPPDLTDSYLPDRRES